MASKKPNVLAAVRRHLSNDEPYEAWTLAKGAKLSGKEAIDAQKAIVKALEMIVSDLDEHGEDNLYLYGDGEFSEDDFRDHLKAAKSTLRALEHPGRKPSSLPPLPAGPKKFELKKPVRIAGVGPTPIPCAGGFLSRDGEVLVLRDARSAVVKKLEAEGDPKAVASSGSRIAVGKWGGVVLALDLQTGRKLWETKKQKGWVYSIAMSPDGKRIASGGEGRIMIQDAETGAVLASKTERGETPVHAIAFLDAGTLVTFMDNSIRTWSMDLDPRTNAKVDDCVPELAVLLGRLVVLPGNTIALYDLEGEELASAKLQEKRKWASGKSVTVGPKNDVAALLCIEPLSNGKEKVDLQVFRLSPLERIASLSLPKFASPTNLGEGGICFLPEGIVVVGDKDTLLFPTSG